MWQEEKEIKCTAFFFDNVYLYEFIQYPTNNNINTLNYKVQRHTNQYFKSIN